jgi:hypothetical protein
LHTGGLDYRDPRPMTVDFVGFLVGAARFELATPSPPVKKQIPHEWAGRGRAFVFLRKYGHQTV